MKKTMLAVLTLTLCAISYCQASEETVEAVEAGIYIISHDQWAVIQDAPEEIGIENMNELALIAKSLTQQEFLLELDKLLDACGQDSLPYFLCYLMRIISTNITTAYKNTQLYSNFKKIYDERENSPEEYTNFLKKHTFEEQKLLYTFQLGENIKNILFDFFKGSTYFEHKELLLTLLFVSVITDARLDNDVFERYLIKIGFFHN